MRKIYKSSTPQEHEEAVALMLDQITSKKRKQYPKGIGVAWRGVEEHLPHFTVSLNTIFVFAVLFCMLAVELFEIPIR